MAYNQYSGYGGNPYGGDGQDDGAYGYGSGNYGGSNPYGGDAGNPYGGQAGGYEGGSGGDGYGEQSQGGPSSSQAAPQAFGYSNNGQYGDDLESAPRQLEPERIAPDPKTMSNSDFLSRVEAVKADIRTLTAHVGQIASAHQRAISSPDSSSSAQLEAQVTQTQVLNTSIKDSIKTLEKDEARSSHHQTNQVKQTQIKQLKTSFQKQLREYREEEARYESRYKEQIARQYRIVNPEATDSEVREAAEADWGNEGVFQTALKSNRSAHANTVLGNVRARHNDILKIEQTMIELQHLMEEVATAVVVQGDMPPELERGTEVVKKDLEGGNTHLDKGIKSAKRARKLKWWCLIIVVAILIIVGLIVGLYLGLPSSPGYVG